MPVSIFEGCTQWCGWPAALLAIFCFGSFGVPIKGLKGDVDPLVMQSYKTMVCFLTCWFVYFLGEEIRWTSWGIISGIFWVPAAACGIYGIRNAGLAICVGVWSSCYVTTSFIWGILIFKEEVKNVYHAAFAFAILAVGLVGMSQYSKPQSVAFKNKAETPKDDDRQMTKRKTIGDDNSNVVHPAPLPGSLKPAELESLMEDPENKYSSADKPVDKGRVVLCGGRIAMTKRQLGICGAMVNGLWGGFNLIPMHFAKREGFGGAAYLVSYAVGSMIVNTAIWVVLFLFLLHQRRYNFRDAVDSLPDFHFDKLWATGCLAGLLYSTGNFGSILAVTYLGQGVGFSLCQVQILVSGLWGIFYFKEIKGHATISKWVISALITVAGILLLSYQKAH